MRPTRNLILMRMKIALTNSPNAAPLRVMPIFAHPDDPEFFCGGALAKWHSEGAQLIYVLATSGDKGSDDPNLSTTDLAAQREREQTEASQPGSQLVFLRNPDGELRPDLALRKQLTRAIRQHQPDIVISNDPASFWLLSGNVNHPDHRAIGEAALAAVYPAARDLRSFPDLWQEEGLAPHKVRQIYLAGTLQPNCKIDISAFLGQKIEAILKHKSQIKDPDALIRRYRDNPDPELSAVTATYTELYHMLQLR
jgi:LmbE family N-acetylglucosaminyl deacetylase